ncbi:MAG: glycerate kinase [Acutalibacter sp.]|nr:glycerate kinase [Acutalibacter sp.]
MKKCIVAPDSFKGTLSAVEVSEIMKRSILEAFPNCEVVTFPVADGGEGTVDCFLHAAAAEKRAVRTTGPYGEAIDAYYAKLGRRAVVEIAMVAGLPQAEGRRDPRKTTTYGLGEVVKAAVADGCTEIAIGLGGSCTNDGGTGFARALGAKFFRRDTGEEFAPDAGQMTEIGRIDVSAIRERLRGVHIVAISDVTNPMYGPNGAAYVFAPQKGADPDTVRLLDDNLTALSEAIKKNLRKDVSQVPGAGAAGALGAGILAFFDGEIRSGIDTVLDLVGFDAALDGAQLVFTGEGKVDAQSFQGKVLSGILNRTSKKNVPVVVVAGAADASADEAYHMGVSGIFTINRKAEDLSVSRQFADHNLAETMRAILSFHKLS